MSYDPPNIKSLVKVELCLEKEYVDKLVWLANKINDPEGISWTLLAEALLQVAIDNTVNDPEQVDEWVKSFEDI